MFTGISPAPHMGYPTWAGTSHCCAPCLSDELVDRTTIHLIRNDDPLASGSGKRGGDSPALPRLTSETEGLTVADAGEDLAQEAFLRVRDRLDEVSNPVGYLTVTVLNLCRNWHRSRERDRARALRVAMQDAVAAQPSHGEHDDVLDVVDRLPIRQRSVLVCRHRLDLPEAEIAEIVGCRPGTVKSLASRALDTIRRELA